MKALVISDRPEIIDYVCPRLKEKGFDLIHYRWIIKALDNIEEIQPDLIVLSAGEYPRHWKTLAGFVQSGIGGNDVKVYLYETTPLSQDDAKKAEGLGVLSFIDEFEKAEEVQPVVPKTADVVEADIIDETEIADTNENFDEEAVIDDVIDEKLYISVEAAFNEACGIIKFCSGKYYEDDNLLELETNLTNGSYLKYLSLYDGNKVTSFSARVVNEADGIASLRVSQL